MERSTAEMITDLCLSAAARKLHLFDFDGTLFKSPNTPKWWKGDDWWYDPQSLEPPCVPEKPGKEWWTKHVAAAKASIRDKNVFAAMCTGRSDGKFRWRVPELLKMAGLDFDQVFLNPASSTKRYKKAVIGLLHKAHNYSAVHIWDDKNTGDYKKYVESLGIPCIIHPVTEERRPALCTESFL